MTVELGPRRDGWARDDGEARPAFLPPDEEPSGDPGLDAVEESLAELASGVHQLASPAARARHNRIVGDFHDSLRRGTTRVPNLAAGRPGPSLPRPKAKKKPPSFLGKRGRKAPAKTEPEPVEAAKADPLDPIVASMRAEPSLALKALRELRDGPTRLAAKSLDLREIAQRLPIELLRDLVAEASAEAVSTSKWQLLLTNMWTHTVVAARAAELVAPRALRREPGAIYTIALLHNIGEFAIVELYRSLGKPPPPDGIATGVLASEMSRFHEIVGGLMLRRLRLPGILAAVAEDHHPPTSHPARTAAARYAPVVLACSAAASTLGLSYREDPEVGSVLSQCAERMGVSEAVVVDAVKAAQSEWSLD